MKVLIVFDHPRRDSFCGAVLDAFAEGLREAGHIPEIADLRAEDFDPRMPVEDEPDWDDSAKRYSDAVLAEQARVERNEALVFVFPVWWLSVPATTKGWIDRVWNRGWAYDPSTLALRKVLMIGAGASGAAGFAKRGYEEAMRVQLVTGVLKYCGAPDADLRLLYDVLESEEVRRGCLAEARRLGREF